MLAMVGILGGAFVGAIAFDHLVQERGGWFAALIICGFVTVFALASWVIAWPIPETQVIRGKPFHRSLLVSHFHDLFYLFKHRGLRYAALGGCLVLGSRKFFLSGSGQAFRRNSGRNDRNGLVTWLLVYAGWSWNYVGQFVGCLPEPGGLKSGLPRLEPWRFPSFILLYILPNPRR